LVRPRGLLESDAHHGVVGRGVAATQSYWLEAIVERRDLGDAGSDEIARRCVFDSALEEERK
jgi:hypothetical protein